MLILFGGSFDPVHVGHILIARDVKEKLGASKVVFMPAYHAPLKEGHSAPPEDRLRMLEIALRDEEGFEVSDYEIRRGGISYTVDTLEWFRDEFGSEPYLLLGSDSVLRFHLWREPERVAQLSKLVVVDRGGKLDSVRSYLKERFPQLEEGRDLILLQIRRIDVSATEVRKRIKEGLSIYCMVPDKVREYIEEKGLYRD